jgi:hypothetical protein
MQEVAAALRDIRAEEERKADAMISIANSLTEFLQRGVN